MPTPNADTNTATVSAAFSFRSVVLIAVSSALASGLAPTCSARVERDDIRDEMRAGFARLEDKIDRRDERVSERLQAHDVRLALIEGAHGAGPK